MLENVSVEEAINKGKRMIRLPMYGILFAGALVCTLAPVYFSRPSFIPFGILASVIAAFIHRSIAVAKWRLWAFENVRNIHELKHQAILLKFMVDDNSILKTFEINSGHDQEKWERIQEKFKLPDIFTDDLSIPSETNIYNSKFGNLFMLPFFVILMGLSICLVFIQPTLPFMLFSILLLLLFGWLSRMLIKRAFDKTPKLILSNEGISTAKTPFYKWAEITDEKTISKDGIKTTIDYLIYNCPDGIIQTELTPLATSSSKIDKLIRIYRGRNNNKITFPHKAIRV